MARWGKILKNVGDVFEGEKKARVMKWRNQKKKKGKKKNFDE